MKNISWSSSFAVKNKMHHMDLGEDVSNGRYQYGSCGEMKGVKGVISTEHTSVAVSK